MNIIGAFRAKEMLFKQQLLCRLGVIQTVSVMTGADVSHVSIGI